MSCSTCQSRFSFFTKEHACPSCGLSNCSKCLKYKCIVPNVGVAKVCGACNSRINQAKSKHDDSTFYSSLCNDYTLETASIGSDIVSTLATLENPAKPPIVIYEKKSHWDKFKEGLDPADQDIVDRLQKLKDQDKNIPLPTVEEIKERLILLKEVDSDYYNIKKLSANPDLSPQDADDLLQAYISHLKLSSTNDPCKEIQDRLNSLRDTPSGTSAFKSNYAHSTDVCDNTDEVTHKLIGAALAEARLEANLPNVDIETDIELGVPDVGSASAFISSNACTSASALVGNTDTEGMHGSDDEDDKPCCVMCDQTVGLMRCMGCTGDLYCSICFEDNHDDFELGKHKRVPFNPAEEFGPD